MVNDWYVVTFYGNAWLRASGPSWAKPAMVASMRTIRLPAGACLCCFSRLPRRRARPNCRLCQPDRDAERGRLGRHARGRVQRHNARSPTRDGQRSKPRSSMPTTSNARRPRSTFYEIDRLVPLAIGGANALANLRPQPTPRRARTRASASDSRPPSSADEENPRRWRNGPSHHRVATSPP